MISALDTGKVGLGFSGSEKFATSSTGCEVTGSVLTSNGSASAPAYAFASDTSSGMFLVGADTPALSSGGSERLRIASDGDIRIGNDTANNFDGRLQVVLKGNSGGNNTAAENKGLNVRVDQGPTNITLAGLDQYHMKLHNASYAGTGISTGVGTISKLLFHMATSNGHNSYAAIAGEAVGQSGGKGDLVFLTGSLSEKMRLNNSGNILHGTTTHVNAAKYLMEFDRVPNTGMTIENTNGTSATQHMIFRNSNGNVGSVTVSGSSTAFNTSSDHRLKQGVEDMTGAIDRVKALAPKRFQFIADTDTTVDGFLAHEAQAVVPEAVTGKHNEIETWTQQQIDDGDAPDGTSADDNKLDGDGNTIPVMQGIDQAKLVPLLTGALQEAIAKIETLETKVAALEAAQ
jgi:hypothetical protein